MNNGKVLILFAHPALHLSRVHARWRRLALSVDHVTFHDLYAHYPDHYIDVDAEQTLLNQHDIIIMQFPLFWFSTPSILKIWQDIVLEYGFAFGDDGIALQGKFFGAITSTGGTNYAFKRQDGNFTFAVRDYLLPLESMARLCGMNYLPPFVVHNSHKIDDEALDMHCRNYRFYLDTLPQIEQYFQQWQDAVNVNTVLLNI